MDYQNVGEKSIVCDDLGCVSETQKTFMGSSRYDGPVLYARSMSFMTRTTLDEAETFFRFLCIYEFYNPGYHGTGGGMPAEKTISESAHVTFMRSVYVTLK